MFNEATGALPYILSRQVKTYTVLAKTRWFAAPDIPTTEELGVPGMVVRSRPTNRRSASLCQGKSPNETL
jgi:tripartite-type tricarboxylate transporter receptor subunit TctC